MMSLMDCYLSTSRIALQAKCTDPTTWQEMHTVLLNLHEHLSCQLCHKLVDRLNPYSKGFACTACADHGTTQAKESSVLLCYKKLCIYIQNSPIYNVMCTRVEDNRLVEILNEVTGVSCQIDQTSEEYGEIKISDKISLNNNLQNQSVPNILPKKKKNEQRLSCRCGNALSTPNKLTCFGRRCPCYTGKKPCKQCKCRGRRNPKQKISNDDGNLEIDKIHQKPVSLELVSTPNPSNTKSKSGLSSYTMLELFQFPSLRRHYEQGKKLGYISTNSSNPLK